MQHGSCCGLINLTLYLAHQCFLALLRKFCGPVLYLEFRWDVAHPQIVHQSDTRMRAKTDQPFLTFNFRKLK